MSLPAGIMQMIHDAVAMLDDIEHLAASLCPRTSRGRTVVSWRHVDLKRRMGLNRLFVAHQLAQALDAKGRHQEAQRIHNEIPLCLRERFNQVEATEWRLDEGEASAKLRVATLLPD